MKIRVFTAALVVLLGAPLFSQTLVANIPFPFHIAGTNFAAGPYQLTQVVTDCHPGVWRIRADRGETAVLFAIRSGVLLEEAPERGALVFNHYGNRYFLSRIQRPDQSLGLELAPSKLEREVAQKAPVVQTASVSVTTANPR